MADVKWIKIVTDIFDDEKILLIESLPEGDSIIVIWFKLLCLAGKQNNSGVFLMKDTIPYTIQMLSTIFRRKETTVELALKTFENFKMIEVIDDVITIPNWSKHQSLDKIAEKNEYMKNYMRNRRAKQKLLAQSKNVNINSKVNSKTNVSSLDKEVEEDKEIDKDVVVVDDEQSDSRVDEIVDFYNNNIGLITPFVFECLKDYEKDFGAEGTEIVLFALKNCVDCDAKNMKYIKATLNAWYNKGIKTLVEAQEENKKHNEQKKGESSGRVKQSNGEEFADFI